VAKACGVPRARIERIAREELGITADTALRLDRYFGIEPQFWLNLQNCYDLATTGVAIKPAENCRCCLIAENRPNPTYGKRLFAAEHRKEGNFPARCTFSIEDI